LPETMKTRAASRSAAGSHAEVAHASERHTPPQTLRFPDSLPTVAEIDGRLVFATPEQLMLIEPWGRDGLRVRVAIGREVSERAWALTEPVEATASIEIEGAQGVIRNGAISARLTTKIVGPYKAKDGRLQFFRRTASGEECVLSEYDYWLVADPGTHVLSPIGEGLYRAEAHFAAHEGERLYGLGQNANGRLDQKGQVIDLHQRHVKAVIPFLVSSRGYGFLWNNPGLGRVEMSVDRTRWVADGCRQIDYYVCVGESYADILERYADVTGRAPMLPYWASGFWQCKLRYETQEELLQIAREYRRRNLPLSVIVIDFFHWKHTGDWKLDPKFWPDPQAMIEELASYGIRVMISPWILVEPKSENYEEMKRRHMFVTSDRGLLPEASIPAPQAEQCDPTNPEAAQLLWSKWKQNYFDIGIRTFWLDPCDPFYAIKDRSDLRYRLGKGVEVDGYFPIAHQKNIYDGLKACGEHEIVTLCRSAWAGSQRYGAALWSGDIESSFDHLSSYMKAGLNVAMSGLPWWTTDIGGFVTPEEDSPVFRELMVRWYQYGVFCPLFRTHGSRKGNEAWSFGEEAYRHIRAAMILRERLRPYVMDQMKLAHEHGLPPMRPLFVDFPDDLQAARIEDQFLFGPNLLIAPILSYAARSREVYLPAGDAWTDVWTGRRFTGGGHLHADAPLEHIPVYVRGDNDGLVGLFRDLP
jgi:alpha-D-xyloside xylohydrolase